MTPAQWKARLRDHGYRDLDEAVRVTVENGGVLRQLADRLGVRVAELEGRVADYEAAKERLPRVGPEFDHRSGHGGVVGL